jgi:cephalosporin hydroxylase
LTKPIEEAADEMTRVIADPNLGIESLLDMTLEDYLVLLEVRLFRYNTTYFGVPALQNPLDFWVYQELLWELQPDVVVEIGTRYGGTALALAHLCDARGRGRVVSVDVALEGVPPIVREHPRITLLEGDAVAMRDAIAGMIAPDDTVLVIEDSSHEYEQTLGVLRAFSGLVTAGSYLIVEDSICHHGLEFGPSPGPWEAVEEFLRETADFVSDRSRESFLVTFNPNGFLRRVR